MVTSLLILFLFLSRVSAIQIHHSVHLGFLLVVFNHIFYAFLKLKFSLTGHFLFDYCFIKIFFELIIIIFIFSHGFGSWHVSFFLSFFFITDLFVNNSKLTIAPCLNVTKIRLSSIFSSLRLSLSICPGLTLINLKYVWKRPFILFT